MSKVVTEDTLISHEEDQKGESDNRLTFERMFIGIAEDIEEGLSDDGCASKVWAQGGLGYDVDGEPLDEIEDDEAVSWCLTSHMRLWDSFPPSMLYASGILARSMTDGVREMAPMAFSMSEFLTEEFPDVDALLAFGDAMVSDEERYNALYEIDWESGQYEPGEDSARAYALLIFMEKLNDYPEMTASEICAWLRSAAADAARLEAEDSGA